MSRRHEDLRVKPAIVPTRDRRDDFDQETYFASRRGAREELSVRSRRSLSPQEMAERSRRTMNRDRRSSSLERRREYEQQLERVRGPAGGGSGGGSGGHMLSRSPPVQHPQARVHVDERGFVTSPTAMRLHGKEYPEYVEYNDMNTRPRHPYNYDDHIDQVVKQKDYNARRSAPSGQSGHHLLVESIPFEDVMERDVGLRSNYVIASRFAEPIGNYSTMDMQRVKDENARYEDMITHENLAKDAYYKDGEQSAYYSREGPYIDSTLSQIKDFKSEELLKNNPSSSSNIMLRGEYLTKLHDVRTLPPDGYPKRYGKDLEQQPLVSDDYGQRILSDTGRGYEAICRDPKCYACDAYKSSRSERKDYQYSEIGVRGDDEIGYASQENLYNKTKYAREGHDSRQLLRPDIMDSTVESIAKGEGSHSSRRIIKNVGVREFDAIQKEMALDYVDPRRSSGALIQAGDYLDSGYPHVELTRKASNHRHISDLGGFREQEFEDPPHLDYGYGRYAQTGSDRTRLKNSSEFINVELQRSTGGYERIKADEPVGNDRVLKRKYSVDEDVSRMDSRNENRGKWNQLSRSDDVHDLQVEWINEKASIIHSKKPSGYERSHHYTETQKMPDETYCHKDSINDGWTSYEHPSESIQEHSGKPFEMGSRHFKGYSKSESSKSYSHVHHSHHRYSHYKLQNFRQRNDNGNNVTIPGQAADISENSGARWRSEPSEDSDDFKQRIQAAFLDFSKRFNENPTARKLYKEEGKAGTLFCVVCRRRSVSSFNT